MKIEKGRTVVLEYRLLDPDGDVVETTTPEEPLTYVHGDEDLLPVLQQALEGKEAGAEMSVEVAPKDGFGESDPDLLVTVPRDEFPEDAEIVPGDLIQVIVSAEEDDDEDGEMEMCVVEISPDGVILDGNHPLAGQAITFELKVVSVD